MTEDAGFIDKIPKILKETQTAWKKFPKPANNGTNPVIGLALAAKSKNLGEAMTNILKSIHEVNFYNKPIRTVLV